MTAALIFDLDGVLVDSEVLIGQEVCSALAVHGYALDPTDYHAKFHCVRLERMAEKVMQESEIFLPDDFVIQLRARLDVVYATDLSAVAGVEDMLRDVGLPVAVASGSVPAGIDLKLKRTGLYDFFAPHVYSVSEVANRKPAPDVFLLAAKRLGVAPENCVVIEDAAPGVVAGVAAGMRVLGFTGGGHDYPALADKLRDAGADIVFDDMRQLTALL
ncbi:MAG: HAD family phosphatase [Alphaproteobacteria bacterium]|nr:HAD family phosphatase [Alphaproteobacteria bacterium]